MFTKADYDDYFDELARIERKMIYRAYDLSRQVEEPFLTSVLKKVGDDEVRHYGYIRKMFQCIEDSRELEQRLETREYCLGTVLLRPLEDQKAKENKAYVVNLSNKGVCLEGPLDFSLQETWVLTILLFGKEKEPLHRCGKVVWSKQIESDFYISGIEFLSARD